MRGCGEEGGSGRWSERGVVEKNFRLLCMTQGRMSDRDLQHRVWFILISHSFQRFTFVSEIHTLFTFVRN